MTRLVLIFIAIKLLNAWQLQAQTPGVIYFTYVPAWNSSDNLTGMVEGVAPEEYKVAVYIYVISGWWTKPTFADPLTDINPDGSWECDITTGGLDPQATMIIAFLVPEGYFPPQGNGQAELPALLFQYPYAFEIRESEDRQLNFSGLRWRVKHSEFPVGPGPNYFSDQENDLWVDEINDELHLAIHNRGSNWYCTEVIADTSFGYGRYTFYVNSRFDLFDPNIIVGLFTWDDGAQAQHYREIDIELGRWGDPENENSQYVVQPFYHSGNMWRFNCDLAQQIATTHQFVWKANRLTFESHFGHSLEPADGSDIIAGWEYSGEDIPPPGNENIRINFWLMNGEPPLNSANAELVISQFRYSPPGDLSGDGQVDATDVSLACQQILGLANLSQTQFAMADVNNDNKISIEDIVRMLEHLAR